MIMVAEADIWAAEDISVAAVTRAEAEGTSAAADLAAADLAAEKDLAATAAAATAASGKSREPQPLELILGRLDRFQSGAQRVGRVFLRA